MKAILVILLCLVAVVSAAVDALPDLTIPTSSGGELRITGVTLVKAEPDGLKVMHSGGMAKVPFEFVPPELHAIYGLSAERAKAHREKMASAPIIISGPEVRNEPTPKEPQLTTAAAFKASFLAQCSPNNINPLDRDVSRKRELLAKKAERINAGRLDAIFTFMAHEHNAKAYRAVGDSENADRVERAAETFRGSADTAARKESLMSNSDIVRAKGTSQAPGNR